MNLSRTGGVVLPALILAIAGGWFWGEFGAPDRATVPTKSAPQLDDGLTPDQPRLTPELSGVRVVSDADTAPTLNSTNPTELLAVLVVDGATGAPVPGVRVWIPGSGIEETSSEAGVAQLPLVRASAQEIVARTIDGVWARTPVPEVGLRARVVIPRETALSGTVVYESGGPAANVDLVVRGVGAGIVARSSAVAPAWAARSVERRIKTDDDGAFLLKGLLDGQVAVSAETPGVRLVSAAGKVDGRSEVLLKLPAVDVPLRAVSGSSVAVRIVDGLSGRPAGAYATLSINWPSGQDAYGLAVVSSPLESRFDVFWPVIGGIPTARLACVASAPGYTERTYELEWPFEDDSVAIRLDPLPSRSTLLLRKPWTDDNNLWNPPFQVRINGSVTSSARVDGVSRATSQAEFWVLSGLEPGECQVFSQGRLVASSQLLPGSEARVEFDSSSFSRLIVRVVRAGAPVVGGVKIMLRAEGTLSVLQPSLDETGTFTLSPLPPGEVQLMVRQSNEFSDPKWQVVALPGGGETVDLSIAIGGGKR